jgi:hypothetical protein
MRVSYLIGRRHDVMSLASPTDEANHSRMSVGVKTGVGLQEMIDKRNIWVLCCVGMLALSGCSRQQSDWQKTRETNTADGYEQFLKKYPSGEFTAQAQARVKELYEERDWQKARDADTPEAYQAFLKQYPEGKWTEEARIRVENFTLAQAPAAAPGAADATAPATPGAATPGAAADAATTQPARRRARRNTPNRAQRQPRARAGTMESSWVRSNPVPRRLTRAGLICKSSTRRSSRTSPRRSRRRPPPREHSTDCKSPA